MARGEHFGARRARRIDADNTDLTKRPPSHAHMSEGLTHRQHTRSSTRRSLSPHGCARRARTSACHRRAASNHLNSPTKERNDHALPLPSRSPGSHRQSSLTRRARGGAAIACSAPSFSSRASLTSLTRCSDSQRARIAPQLAKAKVAVDYKVQRQNLLECDWRRCGPSGVQAVPRGRGRAFEMRDYSAQRHR